MVYKYLVDQDVVILVKGSTKKMLTCHTLNNEGGRIVSFTFTKA